MIAGGQQVAAHGLGLEAGTGLQHQAVARHKLARGQTVHETGDGHYQDAAGKQGQMIERVEAVRDNILVG